MPSTAGPSSIEEGEGFTEDWVLGTLELPASAASPLAPPTPAPVFDYNLVPLTLNRLYVSYNYNYYNYNYYYHYNYNYSPLFGFFPPLHIRFPLWATS